MAGEIDPPVKMRSGFDLMVRLLVAALLTLVLGYIGYLAIALGPNFWKLTLTSFVRGEERIVEPAEIRGSPLRAGKSNGDLVYVLTTQSERVVPIRWMFRQRGMGLARQMLHVDLWAFDPVHARPAWRKRLRSYEDRAPITYELLGIDKGTLWLFVREPLAVAVTDGTILADGARLEALNPPLAGKRVDQEGYVAFGGQGLQLTLTDTTQWVVHGDTLRAEPREQAPRGGEGIMAPGRAHSDTDDFQLRGFAVGETRWLGVLTDAEAETLKNDPVVPGAKPGDRRGAMAEFLATQHTPDRLDFGPAVKPYRVWGATVTKVSAGPADWPKELPDNWGTRDQYSDYRVLPDAPPFLQAGLLGDGRSKLAFWVREPDSVFVLHHDKVGGEGRLRVARVSGPAGKVVWDAALGLADVRAVLIGEPATVLVGTEPNPAHDPLSEVSRAEHERIVSIDVPSGGTTVFDLTAETAGPPDR